MWNEEKKYQNNLIFLILFLLFVQNFNSYYRKHSDKFVTKDESRQKEVER